MKAKLCKFMSVAAVVLLGGVAFAGEVVNVKTKVDRPLLPRDTQQHTVVVQIELEGVETKVAKIERPPLHLAVVLDRSGSMSGVKLEQAKQACEMLIKRLNSSDVVSLVTYDSEIDVLVPARHVGKNKRSVIRKIRRIESGGNTALYAGVEMGGEELKSFKGDASMIRRVLLLSDGLANVGPQTNGEIVALGRSLADQGFSVSTLGLGADYNEDLMVSLAEASDANYYHISDVEMLAEVFEQELGELEEVVARELEIVIDCPEGVRPLRVLGRSKSFERGKEAAVNMETLSAGQQRQLLVECEVDSSAKEIEEIAVVSVAYRDAAGKSSEKRVMKQQVTVAYTDQREVAEKAIDQEVLVAAEIYRNAEATQKAIALADAGKADEARSQIDGQIGRLREMQVGKSPVMAAELEQEALVLEESRDKLGRDGFSKESRKVLKWNIFNRANSKTSR